MKIVSFVITAALLFSAAPADISRAEQQGGGQDKPAAEETQKAQSAEEKARQEKIAEKEAKSIVAAKVNGSTIDLASVLKAMNRLATKKGPVGGDSDAIYKEALDKLITRELAYQQAKAAGLKVNPENIDKAIANFIMNLNGEEAYKKYLETEQLKEADLRAEVDRSLLVELIYAKEVYDKVAVPEDKVKQEYEKEKQRFIKPENVSVIDTFIFNKPGEEKALKKSAELLAKIKADKNQDPWQLVLDGTFIVRSYHIRKDKDKEIYEAAMKLKPGELSDTVKARDGMHILKLKEYSPEGYYTFEEARGALEGRFRYESQQERVKEWEAELRKGASIEKFDMPKTQQNGGEEQKDEKK